MFNEQNEIRGDEREDLQRWLEEEAEREEANRLAPEPEPLTDEEIDAWHLDWCERHGEVPDGETIEHGERIPRWRFV